MQSYLVCYLSAVFLVVSSAQAQSDDDGQRLDVGDRSIDWSTDCSFLSANMSTPLQCADFEVPLDYGNSSSNDTLSLTLVKAPARKQPILGSIIMNPGGPGGSGLQFLTARAQQLYIILGEHFNFISFDPRGVNFTLPFTCFDEEEQGSKVPIGNASDVALGEEMAYGTSLAYQCQRTNANISALLGTAYVARDIIRIVDALGEDGLLKYWGFSYGTVLGATVATMFPERMDRVILDGVANVKEYYAGWEPQSLVDLDAVVEGFYSGCSKSPSTCALASGNLTAGAIAAKVEGFLTNLKYAPMVIVTADNSTEIITYTDVKNHVFQALYSTRRWPVLATTLQALIDGDASQWSSGGAADPTPHALDGIRCSDSAFRTNNLSSMAPLFKENEDVSAWGGLDFGAFNDIICSQWLTSANEVYRGDWGAQTNHPVLLIGATYDPVTPLASARNLSELLPGSVVLEHRGYGHTSLGQPSLCTAEAVRAYFTNGTLPAKNTICEASIPLFSNITVEEALKPLSANGTGSSIERRAGPSNAHLLDALVGMGNSGILSAYEIWNAYI